MAFRCLPKASAGAKRGKGKISTRKAYYIQLLNYATFATGGATYPCERKCNFSLPTVNKTRVLNGRPNTGKRAGLRKGKPSFVLPLPSDAARYGEVSRPGSTVRSSTATPVIVDLTPEGVLNGAGSSMSLGQRLTVSQAVMTYLSQSPRPSSARQSL